ncbi:MAG: Cyclase/dehydrase [Nitrospira sp.]|jgi:uncharacterized membrane protein|nr:Cyclase/dehydrase [Nitrospira sp.]
MPNQPDTGRSITLDYADPNANSDKGERDSSAGERQSRTNRRPGGMNGGSDGAHEALAQTLGWFSIGLGLAQIMAPRAVTSLVGLQNEHRFLLRALGLRELTSGLGILSNRRPAGWVWSRVAGDGMDLALLGMALASPRARRNKLAAATIAVLGVTALDWFAGRELSRMVGWTTESGAILVNKTITIDRSAGELYQFWREFQNLSSFMEHVKSVEITDDRRSRWTVEGPAGSRIQWDAEITEDELNRRIAWRTTAHADIEHAGSVEFTPAAGQRGTIVKVVMEYHAPAGMAGVAVAKLFGEEPGQQVQSDLRRLKQIMETGEVLRSDGSLRGIGLTQQRQARPTTETERSIGQ